MIMKCNCKHKAQDELNGTGMRVHNFARGENGGKGGMRCTVCGNVKSVPESFVRPANIKKKS